MEPTQAAADRLGPEVSTVSLILACFERCTPFKILSLQAEHSLLQLTLRSLT